MVTIRTLLLISNALIFFPEKTCHVRANDQISFFINISPKKAIIFFLCTMNNFSSIITLPFFPERSSDNRFHAAMNVNQVINLSHLFIFFNRVYCV